MRFFLPAILLLSVSVCFGQTACVVFFEYNGTVSADSLQIEKVGLPTSKFLSGTAKESSAEAFDEVLVVDNGFQQGMSSNLSSIFCREPEEIIDLFFKRSRRSYPVMVYQKGIRKGKHCDIPIDKISFSYDKRGDKFIINLGEIKP